MARDYLNTPPTTIRRDDRAVTEEAWIQDFLHTAAVGTLATVHDGQPFVNTNLFIYDADDHAIYTHTARVGRTRANVDEHQKVCFSIMTMGRMLPAPEALEFSVEYGGVTIFGTASIVEDEAEATRVLQLLLDKYAPHLNAGDDYRPPVPEELKRTAVFKIAIDDWSAKKKEVEAHEGAFWYDEAPILQSVQQHNTWQGTLQEINIAPEIGAPIEAKTTVEVVAGKGIVGNRYFEDDIENGVGLTLIAQEDIEAVQQENNISITAAETRRNLLTAGVPLNHLVGKRFRIGDVLLEGVELCEPCNTLATKYTDYGKSLITAMLHRAGLRTHILSSGTISLGDRIIPEEIE